MSHCCSRFLGLAPQIRVSPEKAGLCWPSQALAAGQPWEDPGCQPFLCRTRPVGGLQEQPGSWHLGSHGPCTARALDEPEHPRAWREEDCAVVTAADVRRGAGAQPGAGRGRSRVTVSCAAGIDGPAPGTLPTGEGRARGQTAPREPLWFPFVS